MIKSGMLALFAAAVAGPAVAQTPVQVIELRSFGYAPRTIQLTAGEPVTLTFVNRSGDSHDFTARGFFERSRIVAGAVADGEIEVKGGQSQSVTLIPVAGRYKVHCGHFLHKQFGMRGEIIVR